VRSLDRNLFCMQLKIDMVHSLLLFMRFLWGKSCLFDIHIIIVIVLHWCWKCLFQNQIKFVTRQKRADAKKALKSLLYNGGSSRFPFHVCFLDSSFYKETLSFYVAISIIFYFTYCCNDCLIFLSIMCAKFVDWIKMNCICKN
jgi:hypothetical protein